MENQHDQQIADYVFANAATAVAGSSTSHHLAPPEDADRLNPELPSPIKKLPRSAVRRPAHKRRAGFVVNPRGGAGKALREWQRLIPEVERVFGDVGYSVRVTSGPWDAAHLAAGLVEEGRYDVIVSVGGDGTHNEVINGLVRADALRRGVDFATLSIGSGSDLDKTLFKGVAMTNVQKLELFATGGAIACDLGLLRCATSDFAGVSLPESMQFPPSSSPASLEPNISEFAVAGFSEFPVGPLHLQEGVVERFFLNISGCGIGGAVCHAVNSSSKAFGGFTTFCYATVKISMTWVNPPVRWKHSPSEPWQEANVYMFLIGNGQFQGGGMRPVPHADMADGLLDLVVIRDFGFQDVLKIPSIYAGTHFQHRPRVFGTRMTHVYVEPTDVDAPVWIEADGETPGKLPAAFTVVPNAINIIVPDEFIMDRLY